MARQSRSNVNHSDHNFHVRAAHADAFKTLHGHYELILSGLALIERGHASEALFDLYLAALSETANLLEALASHAQATQGAQS